MSCHCLCLFLNPLLVGQCPCCLVRLLSRPWGGEGSDVCRLLFCCDSADVVVAAEDKPLQTSLPAAVVAGWCAGVGVVGRVLQAGRKAAPEVVTLYQEIVGGCELRHSLGSLLINLLVSTQHNTTQMARLSLTLLIVVSCTVCLLSQQQVGVRAAAEQQQIADAQMPLFVWSSAGGVGAAAADTKHIHSLQVRSTLGDKEKASCVGSLDLGVSAVSFVQVRPSLHDTFEQLLTGVHRDAEESALKQWLDSHALAKHRPDVVLAVLGSQVRFGCMPGELSSCRVAVCMLHVLAPQECVCVCVSILLHAVQLKSSDLKARAMHATLQPLRAMLDQAASSLAAPYVLHQVRLAEKVPVTCAALPPHGTSLPAGSATAWVHMVMLAC